MVPLLKGPTGANPHLPHPPATAQLLGSHPCGDPTMEGLEFPRSKL